ITLRRLWFQLLKVDLKAAPLMIVHPGHPPHSESAKICSVFVTLATPKPTAFLDLPRAPSQTSSMAHTYMVFEFPNEEKAQQARHKLEGWKQAFRLDKKLQVKFDRGDEAADETESA